MGWNGITPEEFLIYKKVYGVRRDCMPCTHQHLREHFALPGRPVPIDNSTGKLGVTGGLRRCQVIPTGWLWFSGTKTNSAAVIQYRFPDNLSAAKVFFRIWPISYRCQYLTGIPNPSQVIPIHIWEYKSFVLSKYSISSCVYIPYIVYIYYNILSFPDSQIKRHTLYEEK